MNINKNIKLEIGALTDEDMDKVIKSIKATVSHLESKVDCEIWMEEMGED